MQDQIKYIINRGSFGGYVLDGALSKILASLTLQVVKQTHNVVEGLSGTPADACNSSSFEGR